MIYETVLNIVNEMHDEAEKLDDDSEMNMREAQTASAIAKHLRLYANKLTLIVAEDMSELTKMSDTDEV